MSNPTTITPAITPARAGQLTSGSVGGADGAVVGEGTGSGEDAGLGEGGSRDVAISFTSNEPVSPLQSTEYAPSVSFDVVKTTF